MDLVGAIYHGRVGVTTHASSAHLVDAVAGNMIVIEVHNVPKAQGVKHLGGIGTDLPIHGFFVVFELTINVQDRLSPGVERIVIQRYFVVVVRQALSKAGNKKAPVTGLEQTFFKICIKPSSVGARVPALPIGAALKAETAHELVRGREIGRASCRGRVWGS